MADTPSKEQGDGMRESVLRAISNYCGHPSETTEVIRVGDDLECAECWKIARDVMATLPAGPSNERGETDGEEQAIQKLPCDVQLPGVLIQRGCALTTLHEALKRRIEWPEESTTLPRRDFDPTKADTFRNATIFPAPLPAEGGMMRENLIQSMVSRFLCWKLPENFNPDGGIKYTPTYSGVSGKQYPHDPVGTNLFDADQAGAMVRHMLEGVPQLAISREQLARRLWELEGARHDNAERVMCGIKPGRNPMPYEPFEQCAESTWYPDADAILALSQSPPPPASDTWDGAIEAAAKFLEDHRRDNPGGCSCCWCLIESIRSLKTKAVSGKGVG